VQKLRIRSAWPRRSDWQARRDQRQIRTDLFHVCASSALEQKPIGVLEDAGHPGRERASGSSIGIPILLPDGRLLVGNRVGGLFRSDGFEATPEPAAEIIVRRLPIAAAAFLLRTIPPSLANSIAFRRLARNDLS
jgi:hypothetical protein